MSDTSDSMFTYQLTLRSLWRDTEKPKLVLGGPRWTSAVKGSKLKLFVDGACKRKSKVQRTPMKKQK